MRNYMEKVMERQGLSISDLNCVQREMFLRGINVQQMVDMAEIPYSTVRDVCIGKTPIEKMEVAKFLKIARALGMTAEELYYGRVREEPSDPREAELVRAWRTLDAGRQDRLIDSAHDMEIAKSGGSVPVRSETA